MFNRLDGGLHQAYSYLENIVLQCKVGEAVPEAAGARLGLLPCLEQVLAGVVNLELRHFGSLRRLYGWDGDVVMMVGE